MATHQARSRYTQALAIAGDIGAPLQEGCALEGIGCSHLDEGNTDEGVAHLHRAPTIYHRIGSPSARRAQEILHQYARGSSPARKHAT